MMGGSILMAVYLFTSFNVHTSTANYGVGQEQELVRRDKHTSTEEEAVVVVAVVNTFFAGLSSSLTMSMD